MRVQWSHSQNFGGGLIGMGFRIIIASTSESQNSTREVSVPDVSTRSQVVSGLEPYRYFSSQGVTFDVRVVAVATIDFETSSTAHPITLPCKQLEL